MLRTETGTITTDGEPVVLGVDGSPQALEAVRAAARNARHHGGELHLVAAYTPAQTRRHRDDLLEVPADIAHRISARGDAEAVLEEAREVAVEAGVPAHVHLHRGALRGGVRRAWRAAQAEHVRRATTVSAQAAPSDVDPRRAWKVLALTTVGVFMAFLDVTIVNTAFPAIRQEFATTSLGNLSWVLNAYNVVFAALLIPAGRLADRVGRRRMFFIGLGLFLAGSLGCGLAPSAEALVAARVLQAVGAAALIPSSLGLALPEFAPERRAVATSVWAAAGAVAAATGPSLGGVLVDQGGWRWAFFVNIAIGAVIPLFGRLLVERREADEARPDWVGGGLIAGATGALALGIVKAPEWGWTSTEVGACVLGAALLVAALLRRSAVHPSPALEPELLRIRSFAVSNGAFFVFSMAFYALLLGNILFLTQVWGYSILSAGFAVTPGPIAAAVAAGPAGRLAERHGPRAVALPACLAFAVACLLYRHAGTATPDYVGAWLPTQLVSGLALGACFSSLATASVMDLPAARLATGTSLMSCVRQLGAVLGIAILVAVIGTPSPADALGRFHEAWLLEALAAFGAALVTLGFARKAPAAVEGDPRLVCRHADVGGHRIAYRTLGRGPVIVLLHGIFDSGNTWRAVALELADTHTVVVPDLLGHAGSDKPRGADYSLEGHADRVARLLDALGVERATFVGHSMGGGLAMAMVLRHARRVERIVLVCAGGLGREVHPVLRHASRPELEPVLAVLASRPGNAVLRLAGLGLRRLSPAAGRAVLDAAVTLGSLRGRAARHGALQTLRNVVDGQGQRRCALECMDQVGTVPWLIVWGDRDPFIPLAHGIAGHEAHADSQMAVLTGAGHHPHVQRPAVVAGLIGRFVAGAAHEAPVVCSHTPEHLLAATTLTA